MTTHDPLTAGQGQRGPNTHYFTPNYLGTTYVSVSTVDVDGVTHYWEVPLEVATALDAARAHDGGLREALRNAEYMGRDRGDLAGAYNVLSEAVTAALATTSAGDADGHDHWYACVRCGADNGLNEASGGEPARYLRMAAEDEAEQTTAVAPRELQEALRRADEALHNARWYLANLNLTSADSMGIARRDAALSAVDAALKANGPLLIRAASVDDER